ncbi:hypothetical protein RclHR1_09760003 [Rhizophagus clarus]|uniref:Uncharacterized protein n=1 Tax=Rhizophagus clarus TaxID=94130 RepID=A0A2Z6SBB1_9GLOM|nr:hypothetical protein RclHR1_09760003 [Rhizophagus clarus]
MADIDNFEYKLENIESKNTKSRKELDKKYREQESILNDMWKGLSNKDWDQSLKYFGTLVDNSGHILEIVKGQNEIVQDNISITRDVLKLLRNSRRNTELLRYSDWITDLIQEINNKLDNIEDVNSHVVWNKIAHEVSITLDEFELLMALKWKSNDEFHIKESQTEAEALETLKPESFSELQCFVEPLRKAINAVKFGEIISCLYIFLPIRAF